MDSLSNHSMGDLSLGTFRSCIQSMFDITNCPICLETVKPEVIQCVNDHLLCGDCKADLTECPTCRQPFSEIKPSRVITQIIEALPRLCKHKGCGKFLEPGEEHEKFCDFRQSRCKVCSSWFLGRDIVKHVKEKHSGYKIFSNSSNSLFIQNYDYLEGQTTEIPLSIDGYFIWVEITNKPDSEKFYQTFTLFANGKPKHNIFVKTEYKSDSSQFMCRRMLDPDPDADPEKNTIHVPWDLLTDFIDENKNLNFRIDILIEKKY